MLKMVCCAILFLLSVAPAFTFSIQNQSEDRWLKADMEVVRLSPRLFHELPRGVIDRLLALGCSIPQAKGISKRHNIIRGHFAQAKQTDWAVLCSRKRTSSILIFWDGQKSFSEIAKAADSDFLQTIDGDGTIGFSRVIFPATKRYILWHAREYHGPRPPPINHQGIDEGFLEKASTIHFYFRRTWRELQGAD